MSEDLRTVCRVRVEKREKSLEARALEEAVSILKKIINNENSMDIAEKFLKSPLLKNASDKYEGEKFIYRLSLGSKQWSLKSDHAFNRKGDAKQKALRTFAKCARNFHFRDQETGEVIKFNANEYIYEDAVGDRRLGDNRSEKYN